MKKLSEKSPLSNQEKKLLRRCKKAILGIEPDAEVILYGSRARGEADNDSDYDLLVLSNNYVDLKKEDQFRNQLLPIELETGFVLTLFLIHRNDWNSPLYSAMPFHHNVQTDGIII